jgi:GDP-L-fucose synthase
MVKPINRLTEFYEGRKILVTGGAGFIGSHLVEMLVAMGAKVTVPVRKTTDLAFLQSVEKDITIAEADLFDPGQAHAVTQNQEVVMHLAAAKGGGIAHSMGHHGSLFRDNMLSFINVMDAARGASVSRTLVVSSACVYPRDARVPAPEEDGVRDVPEPANAGYGWSKRMEEYMALCYAEEYGLNIRIARPFNAYGPRDDFFRENNHVIPGLITRVFAHENPLVVWGSGRQTRSFLYVTDFARGLLMTCAQDRGTGPFNIGSDEETTILDLAELIIKLSGLKTAFVLDTSKPDGQPRRACDTTRAKEQIGFEAQIPLQEGLRRTIDWYKKERKLRAA